MENQLHTVLGATGAIGQAVIKALKVRNLPIRGISRTKKLEGIETTSADVLDEGGITAGLEGATHTYLCVGLPYKSAIWQRDWEIVMKNVIKGCIANQSKLIFLDNMYMYGPPPLPIPFDENCSQQPITKKGLARKNTANLLLDAIKEQKIEGIIGRSADFYGEGSVNSPFYISFLERMLEGKAPQSLAKPGIKHTYANVEDNGKALVELALNEDCYGSVWHLPVGPPITIEEVTDLFNKVLETNFKVQFLPVFMRKILKMFIPPLKEVDEMMYQFDTPYIFSYEKFQNRFPDFAVTPYEEGIRSMVTWFQQNRDIEKNL